MTPTVKSSSTCSLQTLQSIGSTCVGGLKHAASFTLAKLQLIGSFALEKIKILGNMFEQMFVMGKILFSAYKDCIVPGLIATGIIGSTVIVIAIAKKCFGGSSKNPEKPNEIEPTLATGKVSTSEEEIETDESENSLMDTDSTGSKSSEQILSGKEDFLTPPQSPIIDEAIPVILAPPQQTTPPTTPSQIPLPATPTTFSSSEFPDLPTTPTLPPQMLPEGMETADLEPSFHYSCSPSFPEAVSQMTQTMGAPLLSSEPSSSEFQQHPTSSAYTANPVSAMRAHSNAMPGQFVQEHASNLQASYDNLREAHEKLLGENSIKDQNFLELSKHYQEMTEQVNKKNQELTEQNKALTQEICKQTEMMRMFMERLAEERKEKETLRDSILSLEQKFEGLSGNVEQQEQERSALNNSLLGLKKEVEETKAIASEAKGKAEKADANLPPLPGEQAPILGVAAVTSNLTEPAAPSEMEAEEEEKEATGS